MNNILTGKLIRALRKEKGVSMSDFAENLGVSVASISRIEIGQQEVTYSMLNKICEQLEIPLSTFFITLERQISPDIDVSMEPLTVSITMDDELITIIQSLSEEQKKGLYVLLMPYIKN